VYYFLLPFWWGLVGVGGKYQLVEGAVADAGDVGTGSGYLVGVEAIAFWMRGGK
jgi:hypothetical protein